MIVRTEVVYYAMGGGMGHVVRAAAVLRALRRLGHSECVVLTNSPYPLPLVREGIRFIRLAESASASLRQEIPRAIDDLAPSLLVMDAFPTGIVGELDFVIPRLACKKVLVYRHPRGGRFMPGMELLDRFSAVLLAEEPRKRLPCPTFDCSPILVRDARELLSRDEARAEMRVSSGAPIILCASTSDRRYAEELFAAAADACRRVAPHAELRFAWPGGEIDDRQVTRYPLLELLNGVDVVVGAGGCELFSEVKATGAQGVFIPRIRRYDDEFWRVKGSRHADGLESLGPALADAIESIDPGRAPADYRNGASTAARAIANLLEIPIL